MATSIARSKDRPMTRRTSTTTRRSSRATAGFAARSRASTARRNGRRSVPCCPTCAAAGCLDLGCGFGWFCRWARAARRRQRPGRRRVREDAGAGAGHRPADAAITYTRADLEHLELSAGVVRPRVQLAGAALHRGPRAAAGAVTVARRRAAAWSSRSSIRSSPRPPIRAGPPMPRAARRGPSTATSTKARARRIGSPRA